MAPPGAGRCRADLSSEDEMRLEEPMAGAEASEAEATTGLGEDTAIIEDKMEQAAPVPHPHADATATVQTASSEPQPPQGFSQVKRLKVVDLKSLWTRAAKRTKPSIASNSTPILQTVEPEVASKEPEVMGDVVEPEVASIEPQVMGDAVPIAVIQEDQHGGIDNEIDDYDINEEAFYDVMAST